MNGVYVTRHWNWRGTDVFGAKPVICDGGLRYLDATGKEQSAWVGGYYGTKVIDWARVPEMAAYFAWMRDAGVPYMLNVEHPTWDIFNNLHVLQIAANIHRLKNELGTPVWFYPMPAARVTGMMESYLGWRDAKRGWTFARLLAEAQQLTWNSPPRQFARWQASNEIAVPLIEATGVATPSVYRTYRVMHADNLREHVRESRRLYGSRPLIPVVCPCYANNADPSINGMPIPLDDFRQDVQAVKDGGADAVLIWSARHEQVTNAHVGIARSIFGN